MKKIRNQYSINAEQCNACGICLKSCPSSISLIPGDEYFMIDNEFCITCGHCAAVCPSGAVEYSGGVLESVKNPIISPSDMMYFLLEKRSVRKYQETVPEKEILDAILKVGLGTASASNARLLNFQLLQGEEVSLASVRTAQIFADKLDNFKNPLVRFFARFTVERSYLKLRRVQFMTEQMNQTIAGNIDRIFFKAPVVFVISYPKRNREFARVDASLAASNMMILAKSYGLDSCVIGFADKFSKSSKSLRKLLKLPRNNEVGVIFTLGFSKEKYLKIPFRD